MNQKELKELIEYLIEKDIAEFELERGDVKVRIKRGSAERHSTVETRYVPMVQAAEPLTQAASAAAQATRSEAAPAAPAAQNAAESAAAAEAQAAVQAGLHTVRSPIVGTFYESGSPGAPAFVKPGDMVEAGQVLCIIEAMKLMNEIESDVAGEIVTSHVKNAQPIEYGQPLFDIRIKQ
jgi:acetyl-CoA carboxylase biotin carboxyl carrier protein